MKRRYQSLVDALGDSVSRGAASAAGTVVAR
jgi:hypothetical protein